MPDAGELMAAAGSSWTTARWRLREWADPAVLARAWASDATVQQPAAPFPGIPQEPYEIETRAWIGDGAAREETGRVVAVQRGDHWWRRTADGEVETNGGDPGHVTTIAVTPRAWLDPAPALRHLVLRQEGEGEVAGHPALRVLATPVEGAGHAFELGWLGFGADEYELFVHAGRGIVLATEARFDGTPFRVGQAIELELDAPLEDDLFAAL